MSGRDIALRVPAGGLTQFRPEETKLRLSQADAVIDHAKRLHDWPLLEQAVDVKLDEQDCHVNWYRATVTPRLHNKVSADRGTLSMADAEKQTGISNQQVSKWAERLQDRAAYRAAVCGAAYRAAMLEADVNHRAHGTGENEWYTPAIHIERVRTLMGGIDLDPASSTDAQKIVRAARYFTKEDDGLKREWQGRVWLNPPYAQPAIQHFAEKWANEIASGRVTESVMLTHNYTDTEWFHIAAHACDAICFTRGRIAFLAPDGTKAAPTQGQAFFYFGPHVLDFSLAFAEVGFVR